MAQQLKIEEKHYLIMNGPGRHDLFANAEYHFDKDKEVKVQFTTADGVQFCFDILSIGHEDGSGCSFNLEGYVKGGGLRLMTHGQRCMLYYNTHVRQGTLTVPAYETSVPAELAPEDWIR